MDRVSRVCAARAFASSLAVFGLSVATFIPSRSVAQVFPGKTIPIQANATAMDVGDYDGDGRVDCFLGLLTNNSVVVMRNLSGGDFAQAQVLFWTGGPPKDLRARDLNGDGRLDLFTSNSAASGTASIRLANSTGGFLAANSYPAGSWPSSCAVGNLNSDGVPDLLVGNSQSTFVSMFTGVATGTLVPKPSFELGSVQLDVALGEWNGDGISDLAAVRYFNGALLLVPSLSGGGFGSPVTKLVFDRPRSVLLSDLNQDGRDDAVVSVEGTPLGASVKLFLTGSSGPPAQSASYETAADAHGLDSADLDGDGFNDLVITCALGREINVYRGSADGSLSSLRRYVASLECQAARIADFDGDGFLDVLVSVRNGSQGALVFQRGRGAAGLEGARLFDAGSQVADVVGGDFNEDGVRDFAAANSTAVGSVTTALGDGLGGFGAPTGHPLTSENELIASADLERDGHLDLVVASSLPPSILVLSGDGTGSFSGALSTDLSGLGGPADLSVADVSADGIADTYLLLQSSTSSPAGSMAMLGNGSGGWASNSLMSSTGAPYRCALGDLDGDGDLDGVAIWRSPDLLRVQTNDGAGGFTPPTSISTVGFPTCLELVDVDGNGDLDAVVGGGSPKSVRIHLGGAGATFNAGVSNIIPESSDSLRCGDILGQGTISVLVLDSWGLVRTFDASPSAVLSPTGTFLSGGITQYSMDLADYDSNGTLDLLAGILQKSQVSLLSGFRVIPNHVGPFGVGTHGCEGKLRLAATSSPTLGNSEFSFLCTNAPGGSQGLLLVGTHAAPDGLVVPGTSLLLHLDLLASTEVLSLDCTSDAAGIGVMPMPIPNNSSLKDAYYFAQTLWLEPAWRSCSNAGISVVSSTALGFTIAFK